MRRFSGEELKSLALELPEDVLKYKDFGDLEKAKEAADRWLEQPIGEELKTRLRYEIYSGRTAKAISVYKGRCDPPFSGKASGFF